MVEIGGRIRFRGSFPLIPQFDFKLRKLTRDFALGLLPGVGMVQYF
jgi:hypothetical protein